MSTDYSTYADLKAENENLRMRLAEAEEAPRSNGSAEAGPFATPDLPARQKGAEISAEILRDRYSDLYDFAPLVYVTLDNKGIIRAINLTGARLLGTPRPALIGTPLTSHLGKEDRLKLLEHLGQCKQTGEQVMTELGIIAKGGDVTQVQLSTVASRNDEGSILYRTAITDITGLKKTEESLLRLNRLYAVLSETGKAMVRSADRNTLFREICRVAVEHGGFLLARIGIVDKRSGAVNPVASHGKTGYLEDIQISINDEPAGRGPTGTAICKGSYHICNDFFNDPCTRPWHKKAQDNGLKSSASIALRMNGEVIGALTIYAGKRIP